MQRKRVKAEISIDAKSYRDAERLAKATLSRQTLGDNSFVDDTLPKDSKDAGAILADLSVLYRNRNRVYKNNWKELGPILKGFFPNGIELKTETDHIRFHFFIMIVGKLSRYTNNWATGHSDSAQDASVYLAMLDAADKELL